MSAAALAKNIVLSLFGLVFIWIVAVSVPFYLAHWGSSSFLTGLGAIRLIGWIPIILGGCVIVWCYCLFVFVGRGTPWPFAPPRKLVIAGPYRYVRNPMEGSFLLVVLGEAALFGSVALVFYWMICGVLLYVRQVTVDEPALTARFGPSYERYMRAVPRYIPRLRGYREDS
jgi:protein-S-isoprenylcysteine O-methyltransferase Ste14